jgi:hypothetical protein
MPAAIAERNQCVNIPFLLAMRWIDHLKESRQPVNNDRLDFCFYVPRWLVGGTRHEFDSFDRNDDGAPIV